MAALLAAGVMLALVVFPAFAKSREPGQKAHCQNNLRGIGLALLMFSQENDGLFPERSITNRWPQRLLPYYRYVDITSLRDWILPAISTLQTSCSYGAVHVLTRWTLWEGAKYPGQANHSKEL